jgi:uncharacterized protein
MEAPDPHAERFDRLRGELARQPGLLVAYSGGVDSTVLLHAAHGVLGERCAGLIADSPSLPRAELGEALRVAAAIGVHVTVVATHELGDPRYVANTGDRCYWCKSALFDAMHGWAERNSPWPLAYGEIADDGLDLRPGARAAAERAVLAPLAAAGLGKDDVRRYARRHGLPVADKPASACLASRIPVGTAVSAERLARIESAEAALKARGYRVLRVRDHHPLARVELGAEERCRAELEPAGIGALLQACGYAGYELALYRSPLERALSAGRSAGSPAESRAPGS